MLKPDVPAQNTTMPPRFTTSAETGNVASPGCSNTQSTSCLPVMSQIALPNLRASLTQPSYSAVPTFGIWPQHLNSVRLMTPLAPRSSTYWRLLSSEITPMALAPDAAQSCRPKTPRPPDEPHTSTLSLGLRIWGGWPNSIR